MKRILVYGDSITWGRIPAQPGRFDERTRYTKVLQDEIGDKYDVIEEGLRGRMLSGENPYFHDRNGLEQFGPIFASHIPLDLLVIYLGTNDVNTRVGKTPEEIVDSLDEYGRRVHLWCTEFDLPVPKILIVSPVVVNEANLKPTSMFHGAAAETEAFAGLFSKKATELGAEFFDAAQHAVASRADGVHIDADNNRKLGRALAVKIMALNI